MLPPRLAALVLTGVLSAACGGSSPALDLSGPTAGWDVTGGDPGATRYSPLTQIDRENVRFLAPAWTFHTGDVGGKDAAVPKTTFQATAILDEGTLYLCSPLNRIFALDPATGAQRWVHDAAPQITTRWAATCRGVAAWRDPRAAPDAACARRIFMGTMDARLVAVDAASGRACEDFGSGGSVDLTAGLGDLLPGEYYPTSAPAVVDDVVTLGALVADNRRVEPPGGVVRGFDARTGALRWAFEPVPPGTEPLAPAPDGSPRHHRGTPNAWSQFAVDPERGLVFVPFGGPSPDFFGGHRRGFDHYGSSLVALDGTTGRAVWRFQTVHHDVWDYDVASQPSLLELAVDGHPRSVVVQPTKTGHLFVLDRETGEPVFPVEERPVPQSDVPGETTSPTQPFPTHPPPLHPTGPISPDDAWGLTPWDRGHCRRQIEALRNEGIFTPPSLKGSVQYPGTAGGFNWGGGAWDPERGLFVLNQNRIAQVQTLIPRERVPDAPYPQIGPQRGLPYAIASRVLVSPLGIPCTPPPWGTLLAVDLRRGRERWQVPFGTVREMTPLPVPLRFGMPSMGGPIVTASGLVFIGAAMDDSLRAFDVETGEELWRADLPAGGQATPMTYRLDRDARQFVVIAAGGHASLRTRLGDALVAFALPAP